MLDALLDYAGEDKATWDWMYKDAELMDIGSAENEVTNQFRRMVLRDIKYLNDYVYIEDGDNLSEEAYYEETFKKSLIQGLHKKKIDYLNYQNINGEDYIILNTSVKDALNDFCELQVTCKGLAGYMDCEYKNITYKERSIKGFRLTYDKFKDFLDVSD